MTRKSPSAMTFIFIFLLGLSFHLVPSGGLEASGQRQSEQKQQSQAQDPEQKMLDFSLVGYTQKGKKSWEVMGKSADIFSDIVRLTSVNANVYGEEENINLVGDKGAYDKTNGKMHLEDNVIITTQSGGRLSTDSLDWDRASQRVTTTDVVNIEKQNMKVRAKGLEGQPDLKKVFLKDDVQVELQEEQAASDTLLASKEPTVINCDGPLEIDYEKEVAIFNNNVKVNQKEQGDMYADKMEAYFDFKNKKIIRIKSMGNVKIVKGENTSYSEEAEYSAATKKMVLTGRPHLVIYSEEKLVDASLRN
ncbi:MAG: LPS export ABC transporter periplasmic protein LptC [Omnitrophica WOR_2 bacterium RIFCSPHIGHO2_02_FULL_45_21]|nr:MAG: LPS export ABC transporter periplasmic protein LptC [Omnitrophica WOR_2 bacterium RIFCSPHIGHO2_02_FULL_45_21]